MRELCRPCHARRIRSPPRTLETTESSSHRRRNGRAQDRHLTTSTASARRLPRLLEWLEREAAGRRLPAGAEGDRRAISRRRRSATRATARSGTASGRGTASRSSRKGTRADRSAPRPAGRRGATTHSRYIEAAVDGVLVGCLYLPNGNPQPGPKFDYKLAWFERLIAHAATLFDERPAGRARRRLQRRADRLRHLQPAVVAQGRAAAARKPRAAIAGCSSRAGPTRCARCIPTSASTRSGIISASTGSATRACASIICC